MGRRVPLVAVVGRTNVGKSSLFNSLLGKRHSIVEDTPGVTRDRLYGLCRRWGTAFSLVDTGGLVGEEEHGLHESVRRQAEIAISEADLVIALFDGLTGLHPYDREIVELLQRSGKKTIWVVNKCEKPVTAQSIGEFYALGLGEDDELVPVSAAHNIGIRELGEAIAKELKTSGGRGSRLTAEGENRIRVAVVGKPNVGKSTFVNRLVGSERVVAADRPGTTRDSIDTELTRDGQEYLLIDTAGLRKKARVDSGSVERYSNLRALRALAVCDIAVLLLDATEGRPTDQDAKIASLIHERGRGLVIVVNKWDAIEKDHKTAQKYRDDIYDVFRFVKYAPVLFVSALTGARCPKVLEQVRGVYYGARERVQTAELNRILQRAFQHRPPPSYRGQLIKYYFATQVDVAPPTFVLFVNYPKKVPFSYVRFLKQRIRDEFPFPGSNLKVVLRKRTESKERVVGGDSTAD